MSEDLGRRVIRSTTKMALTGVTAGLGAWAATAGVRSLLKKRADEALSLAQTTPLGTVLPSHLAHPEAPKATPAPAAAPKPEPTPAPTEAVALEKPKPAAKKAAPAEQAPAKTTAKKATAKKAAPEPVVEPAPTAEEVGAPGVATEAVEALTEELVAEHSIPAEPVKADLPIEDFDNITVASLRARMRKFGVEDLALMREWELDHAHRPQVVVMLENRIAKLQAETAGES